MRIRRFSLAAGAALVFVLFNPDPAAAQADALAGTVSSAEEGAMEGVLVSARRDRANKTITVVSDEKGRYRFPAARLEPGKYSVTIRAVGYDLAHAATPQVTTRGAASAGLKLVKTRDPAAGEDAEPRRIHHQVPGQDAKVTQRHEAVHRAALFSHSQQEGA